MSFVPSLFMSLIFMLFILSVKSEAETMLITQPEPLNFAYSTFLLSPAQPAVEQQQPTPQVGQPVIPQQQPLTPTQQPTTPAPAQPEQPTEPVDSDRDGITDEEEALYGTNPNGVDTDDDGLTDRDEVRVFKTDPNNPDTDGDTYSDGVEVRNGFDPKGSGKLLEI